MNGLLCDALVYLGIQRLYRNAVVNFIRERYIDEFATDADRRLAEPFQKEWDGKRTQALILRAGGYTTTDLKDDFDLLDVSHFSSLFRGKYRDVLNAKDSDHWEETTKSLGTMAIEITKYRNLIAHPSAASIDENDALVALRRCVTVLRLLGLEGAQRNLESLHDMIRNRNYITSESSRTDHSSNRQSTPSGVRPRPKPQSISSQPSPYYVKVYANGKMHPKTAKKLSGLTGHTGAGRTLAYWQPHMARVGYRLVPEAMDV